MGEILVYEYRKGNYHPEHVTDIIKKKNKLYTFITSEFLEKIRGEK